MKDTSIYDLLNNMDNEPQSYSPLDITPGELNAWKKSFTAKRTATSSRKESSADRRSASLSQKESSADRTAFLSPKKSSADRHSASLSPKESSADRHSASPSWKKFAAAAAIVCLVLAGSSIGPVRQTVYAGMKAVTYDLAHLMGISQDLAPYKTVVGQSITGREVTITLTEVVLDEETLYISDTVTTPEKIDGDRIPSEYIPDATVFLNGRMISTAASGSVQKADDYNLVSNMELELPDIDTAQTLDLEIQYYLDGKKLGTMAFSASGKELALDTKTLELKETIPLPDGTEITLQKYASNSMGQKIYFTTTSDKYTYDVILQGTDDLGNPVEFLIRHMSDGQGRMEVSTITNGYIHEDASSLTLTPYAVKMPETSGKISNDYQPIGQAFTITLP